MEIKLFFSRDDNTGWYTRIPQKGMWRIKSMDFYKTPYEITLESAESVAGTEEIIKFNSVNVDQVAFNDTPDFSELNEKELALHCSLENPEYCEACQ